MVSQAVGVQLELRFYNGSNWSTNAHCHHASTTCCLRVHQNSQPGRRQYYYVRYQNSHHTATPRPLWTWHTQSVAGFVAGTEFHIGDFDIADIPLVVSILLPRSACRDLHLDEARGATPSDSYALEFFDPNNPNVYFITDPPLRATPAATP